MTLTLEFTCPAMSPERGHAILAAMAAALLGAPVTLREIERRQLPDPNHRGACFRASWAAPGVRLTEEVIGGGGNPRDGYLYDSRTLMEVQRPEGEVTLAGGGLMHGTQTAAFRLSCSGVDAAEFEVLRALLRQALGERADKTGYPALALGNARWLMESGDREGALALANEALGARSVDPSGHGRLLTWVAEVDPAPVDLGRRLRESPNDVGAWREALMARPKGFSVERIERTIRRLCPFDASLVQGPWLRHPSWPLPVPDASPPGEAPWQAKLPERCLSPAFENKICRSLTGLEAYVDASAFGHEEWHGREYWITRMSGRKRGRYASCVTLRADAGSASSSSTWTWISGPEDGDFLVILRARDASGAETISWAAIGAVAFFDSVEQAIAGFSG